MAAAGAGEEEPEYFFVGYVQAHGLIPNPSGVQTRTSTLDYGSGKNRIDMKVLSIPGDQYISGIMGPMNYPPPDKPHWLSLSTEEVIPGVLRKAFMGKCDNLRDINEAFRVGTENIQTVYNAAHITFSGGGFTVQDNPPEHQFWQLKGNPGENCRKTPGKLDKRGAADRFKVMPKDAYGIYGICTNHPGLKPFCLTSITDDQVSQISHGGKLITDIISSGFYPSRNMIGHDDGPEPGPLGAYNWISAIQSEKNKTDQQLKELAIDIIDKAYKDKRLHSQHFIRVLQALGIRHAWLYNPTCRDLCEELDPIGNRPPSPPRHDFPDSNTTYVPSSPSPSPSPSPSSPLLQSSAGGGAASWLSFMNPLNYFKGTPGSTLRNRDLDEAWRDEETQDNKRRMVASMSAPIPEGGSRKSRKRTTPTRKKITRKTKKRAYKKKSQKRNRRK